MSEKRSEFEDTSWPDEAHYVFTVQNFVALMRQYGVARVLDEVQALDLDTYTELCYHVLKVEKKKKATAALLNPPFDEDGRC